MSNKLEELFDTQLSELAKGIKERCGADLKVSFYDIRIGEKYNITGDKPGWAASMIKVPVMVAIAREIDKKNLSLDNRLRINHLFTLDPTSEISNRPQNSEVEVFELLNYMILASCNESTNMLANKIGINSINESMKELGLTSTRMSHLIYRGAPLVYKGIDNTSSNTTTANEMTKLMSMIYKNEAASPEMCKHMRAVLECKPEIEYRNGNINNYIRSEIPDGNIVGAKLGVLDEDIMETGVVNQDYAITIILNRLPRILFNAGSKTIIKISNNIFNTYYKK